MEDVAEYCDTKIDKNAENLLNFFSSSKNNFIEDIYKTIEPDLLIITENKDDENFLEEAEINE